MANPRGEVFISYSQKDVDIRRRLEVHLQGVSNLAIFTDEAIPPGALWLEEIQAALARCAVAIFLVSPDFMASDFIKSEELPVLLRSAKERGVELLVIGVSPLANITALHPYEWVTEPKQPLSTLEHNQRELVFARVAELVDGKIKQLAQLGAQPSIPPAPALENNGGDLGNAEQPPAFALVVGISNYQYGRPSGRELAENELTNLKFAAKDAQDLRDFLEASPLFDHQVTCLVEEQATLANILTGLDWLRECCARAVDPLAILFFSGHGMNDTVNRSYLLPYDGQKERLFSTCLWHEHLKLALKAVKAKHSILLIDACHSGAVGLEFEKDGQLLPYDAVRDLADSAPYVIASCGPGQKSYEGSQNGIFTGHLLEALNFKGEQSARTRQDLFDVYSFLRQAVPASARAVHGKEQMPTGTVSKETGIVLALREPPVEAHRPFLEATIRALGGGSKPGDRLILCNLLQNYVQLDSRLPKYVKLYELFESFALRWTADQDCADECAELLLVAYQKAWSTPRVDSARATSSSGVGQPSESFSRDSSLRNAPLRAPERAQRNVPAAPGRRLTQVDLRTSEAAMPPVKGRNS